MMCERRMVRRRRVSMTMQRRTRRFPLAPARLVSPTPWTREKGASDVVENNGKCKEKPRESTNVYGEDVKI